MNFFKRDIDNLLWNNFSATRIVVIAFAMLCGFTGITAGFFEILQGNVSPDGLIVSTVGPNYSVWTTYEIYDLMETYSAITIIPNFLITGICAIIVSVLVIIWAVKFIHKKHGVLIFFILSIIQLLVGGSFVFDLAIITTLTATRINKPLSWWQSHLSDRMRKFFAAIWPFSLLFYSIIAIVLLLIPILSLYHGELQDYLELFATLMFLPLVLMIIGCFSYDLENKNKLKNN